MPYARRRPFVPTGECSLSRVPDETPYIPYARRLPFVPTGECFLSRVPDELLCHILEYLAPTQNLNHGFEYGPCLAIPLVCRRWKRLYYSFLYRNIDLDKPSSSTLYSPIDFDRNLSSTSYSKIELDKNLCRIKQLDATLRQRPDLGDAVRRVEIAFWCPSVDTCRMIAYILCCCKGLRRFKLGTVWTQDTWIILDAAKRAQVATLELSGGPSLQMILKHCNSTTLEEVSLTECELDEAGGPSATSSYYCSDTAHNDLKLLLSSATSCNVTTMVLSYPMTPAHVTRSFLQWPARLTSLTMNGIFDEVVSYTVEDIQGILDDHHHTLQHFSLGLLKGEESLPDFNSLTSLDSLQIHAINLFYESPCSAASKLAAPLLRYLEISFDTTTLDDPQKEFLGPDQITWLERFFGYMTPGTNKLETVLVSDTEWWDDNDDDRDTWPWAYIDQAVGVFAAHNVAMTYTPPQKSWEEWYRAVQQRKVESAEQEEWYRAVLQRKMEAHFTALNL